MAAHKVVGTGARAHAPKVAVIGGGQLARMMQEAAVALGIELRALVESADGSAAQAIASTAVGSADDEDAVVRLAEGSDVLTVEHEHVPEAILRVAGAACPVYPPVRALAYAQDKLLMRQKMAEIGVECPAWFHVRSLDELDEGLRALGGVGVLKTPRDGYDGKGVAIVRLGADGGIEGDLARKWLEEAPQGLLLEEKVAFDCEISQMIARRPSGETASWCAVETIQEGGVCAVTIAPARIDDALAERARAMAERIAEELAVVGVMAVEMFVAGERVLVNELAMRPHNSGHWSIEGAVTSQFEQHLRAILDLPLGSTRMREKWCVMRNLLGSTLDDPRLAYPEAMGAYPQAKIHMYGKEVKPLRKIGHVTVYGADLAEVDAAAAGALAILRGDCRESAGN